MVELVSITIDTIMTGFTSGSKILRMLLHEAGIDPGMTTGADCLVKLNVSKGMTISAIEWAPISFQFVGGQ
jgi:hypothetical protein